MAENMTALKIGYNGEMHRTRVALPSFSLAQLHQLFITTFHLSPNTFVVQYTDADGDKINVCSDAEFAEACRVFTAENATAPTLKFIATVREGNHSSAQAFQEQVQDPIVSSFEKLITALKHDSQEGMEITQGAFRVAAADAMESLETARMRLNELPFDEMLKETSDGLQTAYEGLSKFAQEFVNEVQHEAEKLNKETEVMEKEPEVKEPEVKAPEVKEPPVQQEVEEPKEAKKTPAELKWENELAMVHAILPETETARVIALLEANQGDVNVVVNALMEA